MSESQASTKAIRVAIFDVDRRPYGGRLYRLSFVALQVVNLTSRGFCHKIVTYLSHA